MTRKTFTAFGNCQADALARVLLDNTDFSASFTYQPIPAVHLLTPADIPTLLQTVATADLLLYQHVFSIAGDVSLTSQQVLDVAPVSSQRLSFSSGLIFAGHTPQIFVHVKYAGPFVNEHDSVILAGFLRGLDVATTLAIMHDENFYSPEFSRQWLEKELTTIEKRERLMSVDIAASEYLRAAWRKLRLYDGTLHPRRSVLEHMARQVLQRLGIALDAPPPDSASEPLRVVTPPIYRSTHQGLALEFEEDFEHCLTNVGMVPLAQMVEMFYRQYAQYDRNVLALLPGNQRPFVVERFDALLSRHVRSRRPATHTPPTGQMAAGRKATLVRGGPAVVPPPVLRVTALEVDLLLAALAPAYDTVAAAWRSWQASTDLDTLPGEQFLLLPKLYANLNRFDLAKTADERIQEVFRWSWWRYQQISSKATALCTALQAAGIPAFITCDLATALALYPGAGERPIEQNEIMTLPAFAMAATDLLMAANWRPQTPHLLRHSTYRRWINKAIFLQAAEPPLVLYWQFTPVLPDDQIMYRLYEAALYAEDKEAQINRETLLVIAGIQAATGGRRRLLAAADVCMATMTGPPINWDRTLEIAHILQSARPLAATLRGLAPVIRSLVDQTVLAQLDALGAQEPSYEQWSGEPHQSALAALSERTRFHLMRWQRIANARGIEKTPGALIEYLQAVTGAARRRDLLPWLWRGLLRPRRPAGESAPIALAE